METNQALRLTLCGAFGRGHARDAALATALTDLGRSINLEIECDLLTSKRNPKVPEIIGLGDQDKERREYLKGQPVIVGGHGVIEPSSHAALVRCLSYLRPPFSPWSALFGAAIEPGASYPWPVQWKIRPILRNMRRLYVGDILSEQLLHLLVKKQSIEVIGDPCLALQPGGELPHEIAHLERYVVVALAPRWAHSPGWHRWISRRLVELAEQLDTAVVFLPTMTAAEDDRPEAITVARHIGRLAPDVTVVCIERLLQPRVMALTLAKAMLTIGMRLHPCVLSYAQKTPFVALLHHPKLYGFAATVGCRQNVFPSIPVTPIGEHAYGYDFTELPMEERSLTQMALNAVRKTTFTQLDVLLQRQKEALKTLLHSET